LPTAVRDRFPCRPQLRCRNRRYIARGSALAPPTPVYLLKQRHPVLSAMPAITSSIPPGIPRSGDFSRVDHQPAKDTTTRRTCGFFFQRLVTGSSLTKSANTRVPARQRDSSHAPQVAQYLTTCAPSYANMPKISRIVPVPRPRSRDPPAQSAGPIGIYRLLFKPLSVPTGGYGESTGLEHHTRWQDKGSHQELPWVSNLRLLLSLPRGSPNNCVSHPRRP